MSLIVPEFMMSMPARLTLSTGLDALSHAMESYWSISRNPLSQNLSLQAIRLIKDGLPAALEQPDCLRAREVMAMGSLLAGLAFSMTRTTACHSISYPLTMKYGIEHGFAVALTLDKMAEIHSAIVKEIGLIYNIFNGPQGLSEWLTDITEPIQTLRLSAFNILKTDLKGIADAAYTQGRMNNNPTVLTFEDVLEILEGIY
jgi:alcohol dehydrogenase class IV